MITAVDETITGYADNSEAWSYGSAANFKTETAGELDSLGTGGAVDDLATFPIYPSGQALNLLNKHTKSFTASNDNIYTLLETGDSVLLETGDRILIDL